jgi:hypothetical protein
MLISQVNRTSVRTPKEFQTAVDGLTGAVQFRLVTGDRNTVVSVPGG